MVIGHGPPRSVHEVRMGAKESPTRAAGSRVGVVRLRRSDSAGSGSRLGHAAAWPGVGMCGTVAA